jgi:hypothetical protein
VRGMWLHYRRRRDQLVTALDLLCRALLQV